MTTEAIAMTILTHAFQVVLAVVVLFYAVKSVVADHRRQAPSSFWAWLHPRLSAKPVEPGRPLMGR